MQSDKFANIPTSVLLAERDRRRSEQSKFSNIPTSALLAERARRNANKPIGFSQRAINTIKAIPGEAGGFAAQAGLGLSNAAINALNAVARTNVPQLSIDPKYQWAQSNGLISPGGAGNIAGQIASYVIPASGAEKAISAISNIPKVMPYVEAGSKLLSSLSPAKETLARTGIQAVKSGVGAGIYGATQDPKDPAKGALEGLALGSALGVAPYLAKSVTQKASQLSSKINPQEYSETLMKYFSGGKNLEDNAKSLAKDISRSAKNQKNIASSMFKPISDSVGDKNIYQYYLNGSKDGNYLRSIDRDPVVMDRDLKRLHNNFIKNPTFNNAHALQSEYGNQSRSIMKLKNKTFADKSMNKNFIAAKESINSDIKNYFDQSGNSNLKNSYSNAKQHYLDNVVPYKNKYVADLAESLTKNPRNLATLFKSPEEDVQKVIDDIGENANKKILYSQFGKDANKLTPERMMARRLTLDDKGLESYITNEMEDKFSDLAAKVKNKGVAENLIGISGGAALGSPLGLAGNVVGAGLGRTIVPSLIKYAASPITKIAKKSSPALSAALSPEAEKLYRSLIIPTTLGGK